MVGAATLGTVDSSHLGAKPPASLGASLGVVPPSPEATHDARGWAVSAASGEGAVDEALDATEAVGAAAVVHEALEALETGSAVRSVAVF